MSSLTPSYRGQGFLLAALVTIGIATAYVQRPVHDTEIHELGGIWLLNSRSFFTRRYDFLTEAFRSTGQKLFRFRVLQVRGPESL